MILSYTFSNFCSFKDEFTFSMKPGRSIPRFSDNIININEKNKLLKTAVIVGENGGGKTKFITSLDYLQYMFNNSDDISSFKSIINFNSYKNNDTKQKFEVSVYANNLLYTYSLIIDEVSIISESLQFRKLNSSNQIDVFKVDRTGCKKRNNNKEEYKIGYEVKINETLLGKETASRLALSKDNDKGLNISKFALLESEYIKPFVDWIKDTLIIESPSKASLALYRQLRKDESDMKIMNQKSYLEILQLIDSGIYSIDINDEKPFEDTMIYRKTEDGQKFGIKIANESSGIKEYFAWAIHIWRVIYENKVVFADEMDRLLNPILSEKIINYIHGKEHEGQFIFSTHNVLHLNTINFMKEQMWFVTKNKETLNSKIYSLADFPDFRYDKTNIYELYLKGILGGT